MKRREFIRLFGGGVALWPLGARAQEARKIPRVAFLTSTSPEDSPTGDAFLNGLRELGYVEGRNIIIDWRSSNGRSERFSELAADVVRLNVDVIVAANNPAGIAARKASGTIPIVMANMTDPIGSGFASNIARPGGNVTGLATQAPDLIGKRLQFLRETVPSLSRVAVLGDPTEPGFTPSMREVEAAAGILGVEVRRLEARSSDELDTVFAAIAKQNIDGVFALSSTAFFQYRRALADRALRHRLPMMCASSVYVRAGCLMSYFSSYTDLYRRAAIYVDKILKVAKPADLPIEQPTKFELVINLKTAKALGLTVPDKLLALTDEVIE